MLLFIIIIWRAVWRISLSFGIGSAFVHVVSLGIAAIIYIIWVWLKLQPIIIRNQTIEDCLLLNILLWLQNHVY